METETPDKLETVDDIQEQIRVLQEKARKKEHVELLKESEEAMVEMPLADVTIKIDKNGSDVDVRHVTPAELLFLCAEHHTNAGGSPVVRCTPQGKVSRRDPRIERARLANKYSKKKVMALFPGTEPVMPKTFTRAMQIGVESTTPKEDLLEFHVQPLGLGDA